MTESASDGTFKAPEFRDRPSAQNPAALRRTVLLADDDADDRMLIIEVLRDAAVIADIRVVTDGDDLLDYLRHHGSYAKPDTSPRPNLILLDLKMPKKDGYEALTEIRADPELRRIPVIVLTTSTREEDVLRSYELGANTFISKPQTYLRLFDSVRHLSDYWFETATLP